MASLQQQVKQAYMNNGLTENQANIITAEVGRENSFDPKVLFGSHKDDYNKATNVGMLSWQGSDRGGVIYSRLKNKGLIDESGNIKQGQESLNEMAKFSVHEMKTNPKYAKTKKIFLDNPNVSYDEANKVLGTNYIRWRYNDPEYASGHKNRDQFYEQVSGFKMPKSRYNPNANNQPTESTYSRVKRQFDQQQAPSIASVYQKYAQGQLTPQQTKDFEDDVKSGAIMLPRGASLKGGAKQNQPVQLSQKIADSIGSMNAQQRADLQADIDAGLVTLPIPSNQQSSLPDFNNQGQIIEQPKELLQLPTPTQDRNLRQRAIGALETGATLASGTIGAPIGQALGTFRGAAQAIIDGEFGTQQGAQNILNAANQGAEALTYQPQTAAGQEYVQNVGEAIQDTGLDTLPPVMGGLGVATGTLGKASIPTVTNTARDLAQAAKPAVAQAVEAIQTPIQATTNAISSGANRVAEAVGLREPQATPDIGASVGASQVTQPQLRQALAQDLPVPVGDLLTEGQLSRNPTQLNFEVETAKREIGTPIRQRYEQQHAAVNANFEKFFESTGAEKVTPREIGLAIDDAMQKELAKDKARTRAAYKKAEKSEEARTFVDLTRPVSGVLEDGDTTLINYLNDQVSGVTEPILDSAKKLAVKRGLAVEEDGVLVPLSATIKQMEDFRKDIVAKTDSKSAPDIRQSTIIKNLIDGQTEPYEGNLYRNARQLRREQAQKWESNTIIKNLTNLKRGTEDRMIALEDITDKVINKGSYDDLNQVRKTLLSSGEEGKQAWKELQGATIRQIHDAATAGVAPDANGNQMISPAALNKQIRNLEADNKLDLIFDRETADKLRALNEVSKTLFTVPASAAINHSNTASAIQVAIDLAASAATGLPAPVATALKLATNHIKDRKIKARVNKALRLNERGNF